MMSLVIENQLNDFTVSKNISMVWNKLFFEMRTRSIYILLSFFTTLTVIFFFGSEYFFLWISPFIVLESSQPRAFLCMDLTEPMATQIYVYSLTAVLYSIPYWNYQLFAFFGPAFYEKDWKRQIYQMLAFVSSLYAAWGNSYFYLFPKACAFFFQFEQKDGLIPIILEPRMSSFLNFLMNALTYELLFFLFFFIFLNMIRIGRISLSGHRKSIAFFALLLAAFFSPPDFLTQSFLMAFFLCCHEILLLYSLHVKNRLTSSLKFHGREKNEKK
jgi:sec-independent protein translocase protein TatC